MNKKIILIVIGLYLAGISSLLFCERVPGTKITMTPPDSFEATKQFPGFVMKETSSSIMITPVPGPYSQVTTGFDKKGLASRGMTLLEKKAVMLGTQPAILLHVSQKARGIEFLKWMAAIGDESETVLAVATFPKQFEQRLSTVLKKSILTIRWDKHLKIDFFEGLTFKISGAGDMKLAKKMGNNVILTVSGKFPPNSRQEPLVVVGASVSEDWKIPNRAKFAMERLQLSDFAKGIKVLEEKDVTLSGLPGRTILAVGADMKSGKEKFIFHTLLYTKDGYYLFQGVCVLNEKSKYQDIFQTILNSFKLK